MAQEINNKNVNKVLNAVDIPQWIKREVKKLVDIVDSKGTSSGDTDGDMTWNDK